MIKNKIIFLSLSFLLIIIGPWDAIAQRSPLLVQINKEEKKQNTLIHFNLSSIPEFRISNSGQRVDIVLFRTKIGETFETLPADGTIVKTLVAEKKTKIIISLILRRPPEHVEYSTSPQNKHLNLKLIWDSKGSISRPAIALNLPGSITINKDRTAEKRNLSSKYSGNWESFFRNYELPIRIPFPLKYTTPPFPCFLQQKNKEFIPKQILTYGEKSLWEKALLALNETKRKDLAQDQRNRLELIKAELYLRLNKITKTKKILENLSNKGNPSFQKHCWYLNTLATALGKDPYMAYYLSQGKKIKPQKGCFSAYAQLLKAEVSIDSGHYQKVASYLAGSKKLNCPAFPKETFKLRKAQALSAMGQKKQALELYEQISRETFCQHPKALANLSSYLYERRKYEQALKQFRLLANIAQDDFRQAMAYYGIAMADFHLGSPQLAKHSLFKIIDNYPQTEAFIRAKLKLNDLNLIHNGKKQLSNIISIYESISCKSQNRKIREEAFFKKVLAEYIYNDYKRSLTWLGTFLRNFRAGELYPQAQSLLVELLPKVVKNLMNQKLYLQAQALVQKHRETLIHSFLPLDFLSDLGQAFEKYGFFNRASRVYFYMMSISEKDRREDVYLPLVRSCYLNEEYDLSIQYARHFLDNFPQGKNINKIYYFLVQSQKEIGELEKAANLLLKPKRPISRELDLITGQLLFDLGKYDEVEPYLARAMSSDWKKASPSDILIRAEALFKSGYTDQSLSIYNYLKKQNSTKDQAIYRIGQIFLKKGKKSQAINFWRQLADNNSNAPIWQKLAQESISIEKLN